LWSSPLSPCPPPKTVNQERQIWAKLSAVEREPVASSLPRIMSLLLGPCSSSGSSTSEADSGPLGCHQQRSWFEDWPCAIPAAYSAPLTNPAVRSWLRASRLLTQTQELCECQVGKG
jgi:hypothetical protein